MSPVLSSARLWASRLCVVACQFAFAAPLFAGSYNQNFSNGTVGTQTIGGGDTSTLGASASTITTAIRIWAQNNKALGLMSGLGGNVASWKLPVLDATKEIQAFDVTFQAGTYRSGAASIPGAGWSVNFGALPSTNGSGETGFTMTNGLTIGWDLFNNGGGDGPSIEVFCNGTSVGNFPSSTLTDVATLDSGTFTLTNPTSGGTTGPIAYNANAATLQTAMRAVSGWEAVTVTGGSGASWFVNRGAVGAYTTPTSDTTAILPPNSAVNVTATATGNATTNAQWQLSPRAYRGRTTTIHWDYDGLDLTIDGVPIFTDLPTPGFVPAIGNRFGFSARCEAAQVMDLYLDDVSISTTEIQPLETGGVVITEFMADNANSLEDEDTDSPDWIEIYNGQNATVNLAGYRLTNVHGSNALWTFPSMSLPPYTYRIVYASGKNRTIPTGQLHTNFTLQKESGYLALVRPDGVTLASEFFYGAQFEDVSYGEKGPARTQGFLAVPTPGTKTPYDAVQAPGGPAEDVVWSRVGGIITGATPLSITPPLAPGAVVRYTLDNSVPVSTSAVYSAPFNVTSSTNLRARVFTPGRLPGPISSRTFLLIDSSLTNYNGSGAVFSSNIPVIVFDSFGVALDGENGTSRPDRYTYAVVIDRDPLTGRASLTGLADFQGRGATHVHGESSAGFPQRSYNWETWNSDGEDKDVSLLGIPAGSDWVLHGPFSDKSAMRNHLIYSMMNEMRTDYMASRSRLVEVFFNQDAGQPVSYGDYRGVYTLLEKIKRGGNRVDVAKLNTLTTDPAMITGGYIFKRDKDDAGSTAWTTSGPFSIGLQSHDPANYTAPQLGALTGYINSYQAVLNGANFTDPVNGYVAWIDVSTFIDQQLAVEITKQIDGYVFSTYWNKDRAGKIRAGPIWDFNIAMGNANYAEGDRATGWNYDPVGSNSLGQGGLWYPRLHADPWYRLQTFDRYWQWRRSVLGTPEFNARVDAEVAALCDGGNSALVTATSPTSIQSPAARHFRKYISSYPGMGAGNLLGGDYWPNPPGFASRTTYKSEIDYLKNWMATRLTWLDDQNYTGTVVYRPPNFSIDSGSVSVGTPLSISRYTGTPPVGFTYATGGTLYYTLDGSDPRTAPDAVLPTVYISGSADACKWLAPTVGNGGSTLTATAGANQWTTFTDPPNIAAWTTGTTGIGYDTNPDYLPLLGANANTGAQMNGINATCYLRVSFNIPNQAALDNIGSLMLSMKYDDGFRAYVNGVPVVGRNDSDPSMVSDPSTAQASQIHDDALAVVFEDFDITTLGKPALRVGTNVLAIHCLNLPSASSDLLMVPKLTSIPPGASGGRYSYSAAITLTSSVTVRSRLFANGVWSPITTAEYIVNAVPASSANLVISEVMYNPPGATIAEGNAGFGDNDFEYIELLNIGGANIDLSNCEFREGVLFDFDAAPPALRTLAPGQRLLVVANSAAFAMRYGTSPLARVAGVFSGSLNNGGDTISLYAANNTVIASFTYDDAEPWPVAADGAGYSLVLNRPADGTDYGAATSWRSSATIGGTPGGANGVPFTGQPNGDTDRDGASDYFEYATGTDWNNPASVRWPTVTLATFPAISPTEKYLKIELVKHLGADGVNFVVQSTDDLVTWTSAPTAVVYIGTVNNGDGTATATYRSAQPVAPPLSKRFLRALVSPQ